MKRNLFIVFALIVGATGAQSASETEHAQGPANAAVTIEEYGDLECPMCAKLSEPLNKLVKEFSPRVRFVFHHYPLSEHKYARRAAFAAEAAGLQNKFWEMHDLLYKNQDVWANTSDIDGLLNAYAGFVGLNITQFKADMLGDEVIARIKVDEAKARSLGIRNTPTIFINGQPVDPKHFLNENDLRADIEAALKKSKSSS